MAMTRENAERVARLLDEVSGLEFFAEEAEGLIPAHPDEGWVVRGVTALADDVILIWDATAFGLPQTPPPPRLEVLHGTNLDHRP